MQISMNVYKAQTTVMTMLIAQTPLAVMSVLVCMAMREMDSTAPVSKFLVIILLCTYIPLLLIMLI